ncbi:MAG: outer membrane beta-barrel protein [Acidobacteriaceae bacterium]|nr:outer membrane beta-barrel protein [Acidobacteriaceae bacterium]
MKLRHLFPALALAVASLFASSTAQAQVGIYLNPVVTHVGISTPDTGTYAFLGDNTTSRWFGGVDIGGYYDFFHAEKFDAGIDIRDTIQHANNASLNQFTIAARVAAKPVRYGFRPYGQLAVGSGSTKAPHSNIKATRLAWAITGGADYPIAKHVDFRVIELSYGTVTTISSETERINANISAAKLVTLSSGLVFRFGK